MATTYEIPARLLNDDGTVSQVMLVVGSYSGSWQWSDCVTAGGGGGGGVSQQDLDDAIATCAAADHDHAGVYATAAHNHDATYAALSHNHDGVYSLTGHTHPGGSGPTFVKKTSDQTFNSATPANVTDLVFALTANTYYRFHFQLIVRSDTATVGVASSLTFPAMTRFAAVARVAGFAADGAGGEWQGNITTSDDAVVPTATVATNTDYILNIEGSCVPSSSGNLQVRARTETGTTVVTVRQGSSGMLWDMGT